MVQNFKAIPSASLKLLNLYQDHLSKNVAFLVKSLQNLGCDDTYLIEIIELPNFGRRATSTI